ncbi:AAA family ATPase [Staphylospora marina]|uniref:AAA family ATPase n=1 Tax=Staphylospora marina TaxID=2490858 RepID=UPI000F5BD080|nr:AAA family ATPase [Staphylospora marina]
MIKPVFIGSGIAALLFLLYLGFDPVPLVLLAGVVAAVLFLAGPRVAQQRTGKLRKNGKSADSIPTVDFAEIGGQERAKQELIEALDFLIHHDRIADYGIRPLKGILLTGPPGTGKTLMAKAAAHHTDSVFVSASGSEFVEMYVGVGAQRIRDLFRQARTLARKHRKTNAIVFIDEIDVIGGKREGTSHREYDQTLNQLLTEMDGINVDPDVRLLVMAATNRKDMLDPALLRPGRFDRHISVDLPDKKGRLQVLRLHTRNKPLSPEVDLEKIAAETFGFSGAQLESVTNEAAIYALREEKSEIGPEHFALAIDKVMMGEQTDREASREEKERVAVHELGHAIVAERVRSGSVSRVVLSPRGQALGYVRQHPGEDRHLYTRDVLEGQIRICLAGAAAEEMVYGSRSTGAKNDYEQAIRYARALVETGMSRLGIIDPGLIDSREYHDEIRAILAEIYDRTLEDLKAIRPMFDHLLMRLLEEEELSGDDFRKLLTKCA